MAQLDRRNRLGLLRVGVEDAMMHRTGPEIARVSDGGQDRIDADRRREQFDAA